MESLNASTSIEKKYYGPSKWISFTDSYIYINVCICTSMHNAAGAWEHYCKRCWVDTCYCSRLPRVTVDKDGSELGVRVWVFMHWNDYWRVNNSGKLLWLVLGEERAPLVLAAVEEHEERLRDAMRENPHGFAALWPTPMKSGAPHLDVDAMCARAIDRCRDPGTHTGEGSDQMQGSESKPDVDGQQAISDAGAAMPSSSSSPSPDSRSGTKTSCMLDFIVLDGTWSAAKMMSKRLQRIAKDAGIDGGLPTVFLRSACVSELAKLRPQPGESKTCTAAAAAALLRETGNALGRSQLNDAAAAVEDALACMTDTLVQRRTDSGLPGRRDLLRKVKERSSRGSSSSSLVDTNKDTHAVSALVTAAEHVHLTDDPSSRAPPPPPHESANEDSSS